MSLWEKQLVHVSGLIIISAISLLIHFILLKRHSQNTLAETIFVGIIVCRVIHHLLLTAIWRLELYAPSSPWAMSNMLDSKKKGLFVAELVDVGYFILAGNGFCAIAFMDYESQHRVQCSHIILGLVFCIVGMWTIVSAIINVGPKGLAGADHFYPAEYKTKKLIHQGAYSIVSHPIYTIGMLLEWGIAVLGGSELCYLLAMSSHASALLFLYCTEMPDMKFIYHDMKLN